MKQSSLFTALLALAATSFVPAVLARPAQDAPTIEFPKASPPALVRDLVGLTTVEVEYSRPSVKGRTIFGGLVANGEVWRTGANAATKVTFSTDVTFGGKAVPAGTYALFTIPGEAEWTVILNKGAEQWGSYGYDQASDVARVTTKPMALAKPVETFRISLEHLRDSSAQFTLAWDKTRVSVPIETDLVSVLVPQIEKVMASEGGKKPYLAAAMFYYEHDVDLDRSLEWIDAALAEQPEAVWIVYRKGLILRKIGDMEGAFQVAEQSLDLATRAGGSLGAEYKRLSEELISSLD